MWLLGLVSLHSVLHPNAAPAPDSSPSAAWYKSIYWQPRRLDWHIQYKHHEKILCIINKCEIGYGKLCYRLVRLIKTTTNCWWCTCHDGVTVAARSAHDLAHWRPKPWQRRRGGLLRPFVERFNSTSMCSNMSTPLITSIADFRVTGMTKPTRVSAGI